MKKNDVLVGEVIDYGSEGEGIIKIDDFTVFVPNVINDEIVEFKVLKVVKNIVYGKCLQVLKSSSKRIKPQCLAFTKCGGCQLLHMQYEEQLKYKSALIANSFKKIAHINLSNVDCVSSEPNLKYRNKISLPIRSENGQLKIGFFAPKSHRIIQAEDCVIHCERFNLFVNALNDYIQFSKVLAYDELTNKGLLRHFVVKTVGDEFLVILVINGNDIPYKDQFVSFIKRASNDRKCSIYLNVNKEKNNIILGKEFINIYGDGFLHDCIDGIKYTIGPQSFIQINDDVKNKLYKKAVELATVNPFCTVIDAYCGAGLMTALIAKYVKKAIGIEIVSEAIQSAKNLAIENGLNNIDFYCGACEDILPEVLNEQNGEYVLLLDPPRKGLDRALAERIARLKPKKIIYISCNPATLARDVGIITGTLIYDGDLLVNVNSQLIDQNYLPSVGNGYKIQYVCGYDMFAQCKGVETLVCLTQTDI